ncbi:MAG: TraR/DksA family transcriptional regulator [Bacteroidales bacterium]
MKRNKPGADADSRRKELRELLERRRSELMGQLQATLRDVSATREVERHEVRDDMEQNEVEARHDVNAALLEIRAETLRRIDEALRRLAAHSYGCCVDCGRQIAVVRLAALPFATRCTGCEEEREQASRVRVLATKRYRIGAHGWADEDAFEGRV